MPAMTEATRAWIYRVVFAALGLGLVYGIINSENIDDWILLVGAVLGVGTNGLASLHTSTKRPEQPEALDGDLDRGESLVVTLVVCVFLLVIVLLVLTAFGRI